MDLLQKLEDRRRAYQELKDKAAEMQAEQRRIRALPFWRTLLTSKEDLKYQLDSLRQAEQDYEDRMRQVALQIADLQTSIKTKVGENGYDLFVAETKYKRNPTPEEQQSYYREFVRTLNKSSSLDKYDDLLMSKKGDQWSHAYVGSLFVPKPDPLGRFMLTDQYSTPGLRGVGAHLTVISGSATPIILCETHPDNELAPREGYLRAHSLSPGGARFGGQALGTAGYLGTVLAAKVLGDMKGLFSWHGGAGRTSAGASLWYGLVNNELAYISDKVDSAAFKEEQKNERRASYEDDDREEDTEREYMDFATVIKTPFYAFVPSAGAQGWLHTGMRHMWSPETNKQGLLIDVTDKALARFFDASSNPQINNELTQNMLVNSFHGDSGFLVLTIAEALARSGAQDKAATYLNRTDVAALVAGNPRVAELIGQKRLPGVAGLSRDMHRAVLGAIAEAKAGTKIDWSAENPLRLQPMPSTQKKRLAKFSDLD